MLRSSEIIVVVISQYCFKRSYTEELCVILLKVLINMPLVGGTGDLREPDDTVQQITKEVALFFTLDSVMDLKVKDEVQAKSGLQFSEFTPINFRSQMVNGVNYFIKVRHAPGQHLHLRVHRSFQGDLTVSAFQLNKSLQDDIAYFQ